jgi:hypothetical protein
MRAAAELKKTATHDDLNDPRTRAELSAPLVSLFFKLAARWGLSVAEQCTLLGGIARQTLNNWSHGNVGKLNRDQVERLSLALGIHKGLRLVFADDDTALRWLAAPNADAPFFGLSPKALALSGGIRDLVEVRRYLDAWRGVR